MKTVFDIGMYDGTDTAYYLESGYRVVAVEANPLLVERAQQKFAPQLASGQLVCVHAAVAASADPVELIVSGDDLGASSIVGGKVAHRRPIGSITVQGMTMQELFARHGVPYYMKVDIEGADRLCVLGLTPKARPDYVSFEIGDDVEELIAHAQTVGLTRFKIINQVCLRELAHERSFSDRAVLRLIRSLGYAQPRMIRRDGRFFSAGLCSGPVPWKTDGRWYTGTETISRWRTAKVVNAGSAWYDIHASIE